MAKQGTEEPLFNQGTNQDDSFFENIDRSPQYDNNLNTKPPGGEETNQMTEEERREKEEEWRKELLKLEEEIHTLQSVLSAKIRCAGELKRKLGYTPYVEFKQDLTEGIKTIKESDAYQYTNEKLTNLNDTIHSSSAYQKTSDAFKTFGAFASKKLGDARNSTMFKSVEEKVGGAYSSVKTKVTGSRSENSFQELKNEGAPQTETAESGDAPPPSEEKTAVEPASK